MDPYTIPYIRDLLSETIYERPSRLDGCRGESDSFFLSTLFLSTLPTVFPCLFGKVGIVRFGLVHFRSSSANSDSD